jgi:hypothetical protein
MLGLQRLSKVSKFVWPQKVVSGVTFNRNISQSARDTSLESTLEELGRLLRNTTPTPQEEVEPPKKQKKKSLEPKKLALEDLKYLHLYPKVVQRLVLNAKSPFGYYDEDGNWIETERESNYILADKKLDFTDEQLNFKPKATHPKMEGVFRFGITEEEIKDCHPRVKEFFSMANAPAKEVQSYKNQQLISKYGKNEYDSGSIPAQSKFL